MLLHHRGGTVITGVPVCLPGSASLSDKCQPTADVWRVSKTHGVTSWANKDEVIVEGAGDRNAPTLFVGDILEGTVIRQGDIDEVVQEGEVGVA